MMLSKQLFYGQEATIFILAAMFSSAQAQVAQPTLPTNVPGIRLVAPPPTGFNPLTASPAARLQHGVPPAPDATAAPRAYNEWQKAVTGPQNRVIAPTVEQTQIVNGPIKKMGSSGPQESLAPAVPQMPAVNGAPGVPLNSIVSTTSTNWSGSSFVSSSNPFAVAAIIGEFVVPTARQGFGACTGGWDYASLWPGIDGNGNGSSDVLQAGVEADAYCSGSTTASFYSAWIEWYPFTETRVSSPVISAGDVVFVEVWNVSATQGYAYFYNFSTQTAASYQLTAPSGTSLVGNSAEWIVERPSISGTPANLTNYIDASWPYNVAWNYAASNPAYYYPGFSPIGTLELISMLDNNNQPISHGAPLNNDFLYFTNSGSSFGSGTPPYSLATAVTAGGNAGSR
jgi:hypothetical protein